MSSNLISSIIFGVVALVLGIPLLRLIRLGRIQSVSAGRDGIKLDMSPVDKRASTQHSLDKRILEIDEQVEYSIYNVTAFTGRSILRTITRETDCMPTAHMIATELKNILYQALRENNFKVNLNKDNRARYIETKMGLFADVYDDLMLTLSKESCVLDKKNLHYPTFADISGTLTELLAYWVDAIRNELIKACEKKIETYKEFKTLFIQAQDTYFEGVVNDCISKNEAYIVSLQ